MLNFKSHGVQKQSHSLNLDSQRLVLFSSSGGHFACTNAHTQVDLVYSVVVDGVIQSKPC